jgi:hypothetical protein
VTEGRSYTSPSKPRFTSRLQTGNCVTRSHSRGNVTALPNASMAVASQAAEMIYQAPKVPGADIKKAENA